MTVKWTEAQKLQAVTVYAETANLGDAQTSVTTEAGEKPGKTTIKRWAVAQGHDIAEITSRATANTKAATAAATRKWQDRRADMVHELGDTAQLALDQTLVYLACDNPKDAKDAATTCAILIDKAQVLSGDASSIVRTPWDPQAVVSEAEPRAEKLRPKLEAVADL